MSDLPDTLLEEIRTRVFGPGFIRLTQSLTREGKPFRISLRPVRLKGETFFQAEMTDDGKSQVRNLSEKPARKGLEDILNQPGKRDLHLVSTEGDLHIRVTKKGRPLISRGRPKNTGSATPVIPDEVVSHDRVKKHPLSEFDASALLRVLGLAAEDGKIKPSMRGKYDQVNALLRAVEPLLPETPPAQYRVVDCGCGKAYLTLALQQWLTLAKGWPCVKILGIDKNATIVASATEMANALGIGQEVTFQAAMINDADIPERPNLVMSLHACDTATDDALIMAVEKKADAILCVPCCQHELHHALVGGDAMRSVLRHGILRERLADLLTDTFRAQVLRICGYRARVMEFVSAEATGRNILIRAEKGLRPGLGEAIAEYRSLCDFWGVKPYIGRLLPEEDA
ncbi:MAG: SAM-dependent methyltransferase [bacterium]|nr:SAM-dependent methyltransferase [bacterium]